MKKARKTYPVVQSSGENPRKNYNGVEQIQTGHIQITEGPYLNQNVPKSSNIFGKNNNESNENSTPKRGLSPIASDTSFIQPIISDKEVLTVSEDLIWKIASTEKLPLPDCNHHPLPFLGGFEKLEKLNGQEKFIFSGKKGTIIAALDDFGLSIVDFKADLTSSIAYITHINQFISQEPNSNDLTLYNDKLQEMSKMEGIFEPGKGKKIKNLKNSDGAFPLLSWVS